MTMSSTIKQSLYVRASMFTADELRRQKRLGLNAINESVLEGLVSQRRSIEEQQNRILRSLTVSLFFAFIARNGGNIQIPGTGASIAEVPAFLELSLIVAAFCILMINYSFISVQMYNAIITAVASEVLAKNKLDPDLFGAAHAPTWLFIKYSQPAPVNGRIPGFKISKLGGLFYGLMTGSMTFIFLALWIFAIASTLYIAHSGLSNSVGGWSTYSVCIAIICVSFISMAANVLEFTHEMDFDHLERMDSDNGNL